MSGPALQAGDHPAEADAARARQAFIQACGWDVAVRKPGNVSQCSAGHRMQAQMFLDSAESCASALCTPGATVGQRIEAAVAATWARVGCNTNLGIVLLCAPLARLAERPDCAPGASRDAWRQAWQQEMAALSLADAQAAFRAIAQAQPGGLGEAPEQDVHQAPSVTLAQAMALAAGRDRIAAQYGNGAQALFEVGLPALATGSRSHWRRLFDAPASPPDAEQTAAVQAVYLALLASGPDSHIARKHGPALAHSVTREALSWWDALRQGRRPDTDPAFAAWDEQLKSRQINPGSTADLTVATLMLAALAA